VEQGKRGEHLLEVDRFGRIRAGGASHGRIIPLREVYAVTE
jgi:hypothetical protein